MIAVQGTISATSPAAASTGLGTANTPLSKLDDCDALILLASLVGATGGTLDVYLQHLVGDQWVDYIHFAQLADGASAVKKYISVSKFAQVVSQPSVGVSTSPALGANTIVGGPFGSEMRLLFTAGAGTSAGAAISVAVTGIRTSPWR